MYDYLIVGSGLFGATFASLATKKGKKCLVIEKADRVGGAIRTERVDNIDIHVVGAHIFHTSYKEVYDYFCSFGELNNYVNMPIALNHGKLYHMPFNMDTFYALWGVRTPEEAKAIIDEQVARENIGEPKNLEEQALKLVGRDVYETLVKGYTEKQWGRDCKDLPPSIIKRLPLRLRFDNNYFNDRYQGIPVEGYTSIIEKMLEGSDVLLNTDFLQHKEIGDKAKKIIYTGEIDRYYGYCLGKLEYRTEKFVTERFEKESVQGTAVINYTSHEVPYTRTIEHKFFNTERQSPVTYVTKEYPKEFEEGDMPLYPLGDEKNLALHARYKELAASDEKVVFAGRLGQYKYYDMDDTMYEAMKLFRELEG